MNPAPDRLSDVAGWRPQIGVQSDRRRVRFQWGRSGGERRSRLPTPDLTAERPRRRVVDGVRELGEREKDEQGEDENKVGGVRRIGHPDSGETKDLGEE